jgi:hypothetical protein
VEATGVELITILITRNLLILGTATKAKKAPLSDPLYVYCTKMPFSLSNARGHRKASTVSHRFARMDREKAPSTVRYCKSLFPISSVRGLEGLRNVRHRLERSDGNGLALGKGRDSGVDELRPGTQKRLKVRLQFSGQFFAC